MALPRRRFLRLAAAAGGLSAVSGLTHAQGYPTRPIRLVVPFPPGGAFDGLARPWADGIKTALGPVVIENIGGAGASLGSAAVARAQPDGYTLLLGGSLTHVNEALLKRRPLYDPERDLDPVIGIAIGHMAIAVHPSLPCRNLLELVGFVKANPGKLSYGHVGLGSTNHLTGESFKSIAGIPDLVQIPYRGAAPLITDLIAGQIAIGVVAVTGPSLASHRSGRIRLLTVASGKPLPGAPEIPTVAAAGFPDLANDISYGLLAPAGTPKPIVDRVAEATQKLLATSDYQRIMTDIGFEATPQSNPNDFRQTLSTAVTFWRPIVEALQLKVD
jgi:tripartite-type tricarboxylate transporter receptor subunit TctC